MILIDNGVMPADEMMATITRPDRRGDEEHPRHGQHPLDHRPRLGGGQRLLRLVLDMIQAELYVLGRLAQIRATLPRDRGTTVSIALTFSAFPIIGISLTSKTRNITELWETARYDLNPRFLRIQGVARVNLVGGRVPEYHVVVDPLRLQAANLSLTAGHRGTGRRTTSFTPAGMHEENRSSTWPWWTTACARSAEIENVVVAVAGGHPVRIRDYRHGRARARAGLQHRHRRGRNAVLMNIYGQPDGNTVAIAERPESELQATARNCRRT